LKERGINFELIATDINVTAEMDTKFKREGVRLYSHDLIKSNLLEDRQADIVRLGYVFRYIFAEKGLALIKNIIRDVKPGGYIIFEDFYGAIAIYKKISAEKLELLEEL
jgi:DNA modification methylase